MKTPEEEFARLQEICHENGTAMENSAFFLVPFEGHVDRWRTNVVPMIQMGAAVYLDKPLLMLVRESLVMQIPDNLRRLCHTIEIYKDDNPKDMERAMKALMEYAIEHGIIPKRE